MPGKKLVYTFCTTLPQMGSQLDSKARKFRTLSHRKNVQVFMVRTFWIAPCLITMDQPNTSNTMGFLDHVEIRHANTKQPVLMTIAQRMVETSLSLVKTSQPRQIHVTSRHASKSTLTASRVTGVTRHATCVTRRYCAGQVRLEETTGPFFDGTVEGQRHRVAVPLRRVVSLRGSRLLVHRGRRSRRTARRSITLITTV